MICNKCGAQIPDGSLFCISCGQPVAASGNDYFSPAYDAAAPTAAPAYDAAAPAAAPAYDAPAYGGYEAPAEAPAYGGYEAPAAAPGYGGYEASASESAYDALAGEETAPAKTKGKGLKIGLLLGSIGLVLVVGIVLLCVWLSYRGPVTDIAVAFSDLIEGGNFTVDLAVKSDGESEGGTLMVDMDLDDRELTVCALEDGEIVGGVYDGYYITKSSRGYKAEDISDELEDFFDQYEENSDMEDIDWEELLDEIQDGLYDEASEYIDFDILNDSLTAYFKTINDEQWLEENAGFSQKEKNGVTYYIFEPNIYDFTSASLAEFEEVFVDEDFYDELCEGLEEIEEYTDKVELEFQFGLDGGDLVSIEFNGDASGDKISIGAEFSDIGDTEIDTDELADILEEALENETDDYDDYVFDYDYYD